jgi:hypothetical protein
MVAGSTIVELRVEWTFSWALNSIGINPTDQFYVPLQPENLETLRDGIWQPDVKVYREMIEWIPLAFSLPEIRKSDFLPYEADSSSLQNVS